VCGSDGSRKAARVGVDVRCLRMGLDQASGIGVATREVIGRLLIAADGDGTVPIRLVPFGGFVGSRAGEALAGWSTTPPRVQTSLVPGRILLALWRRGGWPAFEKLIGEVDLLHGPDHFLPPHRCPRRIYTVHDTIVVSRPDLVLDDHRRYVEEHLPAWHRDGTWFIAVSEFTRQEMVTRLGLPGSRIRVIPNGVAPEFRPLSGSPDDARVAAFRAAHSLSSRFLLGVGNTNPNKNLPNLLRAVRLVLERTAAVDQMVLCGNQVWREEIIRREATQLGDRLRMVTLPRAEMPLLYGAARALVFPSLFEGFGLPLLEAMACGTPVAVSRTTALPEVAGDAAVYFDPLDPESIAAETLRLVEDDALARRLVERGFARVARFSWDGAARATLAAYRDVLAA
jgi:glycosyltransferase involved in cell wall biosynthesis